MPVCDGMKSFMHLTTAQTCAKQDQEQNFCCGLHACEILMKTEDLHVTAQSVVNLIMQFTGFMLFLSRKSRFQTFKQQKLTLIDVAGRPAEWKSERKGNFWWLRLPSLN